MGFAPPSGEFRLTMPGAARPVTLTIRRTGRGATVIYSGRRWVGYLQASGQFHGRPWVRVALDRLAASGAQPVQRCADCHRELTDPESQQRGVGPDCWAARERSA